MAFSCYACGYTSTRAAGLTNHKKTCQEHLRRVSSVTETFLRNDSKQRAEKRHLASGSSQSPQKRSKTQENSSLMADITVGENIDVDVPNYSTTPPVLSTSNCALETALPSTSPLPPMAAKARRSTRIRFPTWKIRESLPDPITFPSDSGIPPDPPQSTEHHPTRRVFLLVRAKVVSIKNKFGLSRVYKGLRSRVPDTSINLPSAHESASPPASPPTRTIEDIISPYPNLSSFLFDHQFWTSAGKKSRADRDDLAKLMAHPNFKQEDIIGVNFRGIEKKLKGRSSKAPWEQEKGWQSKPLTIGIPLGIKRTKATKSADARIQGKVNRHEDVQYKIEHTIPGSHIIVGDLHYRPICDVIRETFSSDPTSNRFHYHPYEETWERENAPPGTPPERVYGELYSSKAWIDEDRKIQFASLPEDDPDKDVPRVVAAMSIASDATKLGQFGVSKAWPVYVFFGNQSKYERNKPSAYAAHHIAYLPSLPDGVRDKIQDLYGGKKPSAQLLTHCRRELFQSAWVVLLSDEEFQHAYKYGMVVDCSDGIRRRLFPRIFTYSADYPEKVLVATIRDQGRCPCVRCLVTTPQIPSLGTTEDRLLRQTQPRLESEERQQRVKDARDKLYREGYVITGDHVDGVLKDESLVPTQNSFSQFLLPHGFDIFKALTVDLLHEFELGVWKAVFIHLIRILNSVDIGLVHELDHRFRQIPSFGQTTIRRFTSNISEMKQLAARDYEDILQCIAPCFEGLLPEPYNSNIRSLLFILTTWHALAKLRIHTDSSLALLDEATTSLGCALRHLATTISSNFPTCETPAEYAKRQRTSSGLTAQGRQPKGFNMCTIKLHSLGDYVSNIKLYGTIENYSTSSSELAHTRTKVRSNCRTNKRDVTKQLANIDFVESEVRRMAEELRTLGIPFSDTPTITPPVVSQPETQFWIANEPETRLFLAQLIMDHKDDHAYQNFIPSLMEHLYQRLCGSQFDYDPDRFTDLIIRDEAIHRYPLIRFNFTTYDVQRDQDIVHPAFDKRDIMVYCPGLDGPFPWRYARVQGIFHANVQTATLPTPKKFVFLWVRWFTSVDTSFIPAQARSYPKISFIPYQSNEDEPFGFVDPEHVIRGCHLIPAFELGRSFDLLPPSVARDKAGDWKAFCVNCFADRDTYMRFTGLGVGSLDLQARQVCRMSVEDIMDYHKVNDHEPMVIATEPDCYSDMEASCSDGEQGAETPPEDSEEFD